MIDGTSDQPFLLEIFATSQPDIFENICPMTYLVCTQMRVIQEYPDDVSYKAYLTTTNESQVFITGHHKGQPYTRDEKVKKYIKWINTQNESAIKKKLTIGGYHPYPPTPSTFSKFCHDRKTEEILTTIRELKETIEQLHYREHKRVAIQGIIAACTFMEDACKMEMHEELVSFQQPNVLNTGSMDRSCEVQIPCRDPAVVDLPGNNSEPRREADNLVKRRKLDLGVGRTFSESETIPVVQLLDQNVDARSWESLHFEDDGAGSCVAESEASDETSFHRLSWENPLWSDSKHNVKEHLYYSKSFPESLTQKFDHRHKEVLFQQYNLHPAKVTNLTRPRPSLTSARSHGHYELTILGINQNIAIDVSLPVFENVSIFGMNYLPNHLVSPGASDNDENKHRHWLSLRGELEEYARTRNRLHVICILDICHLGESNVEVCLHRIYYPTTDSTD